MPNPSRKSRMGPRLGYAYRQWPKAIEGEQELRRLHPALRLRYAIDHGWQPGLYLAEDLVLPEPPPQGRRGVFAFLVRSSLRQGSSGSPRGMGIRSRCDSPV
jgi:hypothetical protein